MRQAIRIIVCWLCFWSTTTQALLNIEITQGIDGALPIAIMPLTTGPTEGESMIDIIQADLKLSGQFSPLAEHELPFQDMGEWVYDLEIAQWRHLGAEYVLLGSAYADPITNTYDVKFSLIDVYQAQTPSAEGHLADGELLLATKASQHHLFEQRFEKVAPNQFRDLAHHVADRIYESITGLPGHFSTRIAYVHVDRTQALPYALVIADMDGHRPQTVVHSSEPLMSPAWAPDGETLAYVSFENFRSEIYLLDVSTGQRRLLTHFPRINGAPAFSPDGKSLALVLSKDGAPKLYRLWIETGKLEQLTTGMSIDTEPAWAPDGRSLIFTSNRGGAPQIYRLWLEKQKIERLTYEGTFNARASFTPDGESLVMIHRGDDKVFRVAKFDLHTQQWRYLSKDMRADESPSLSPNGQMVLYATVDNQKGILAAASIDGRVQLHLPSRDGSVQEPAWSPYLS